MNNIAQASDLQEDAKLVIEVMNEKEDVRLDFSPDSISWLDTYINQHRANLDEEDKRLLREKFGAFVGETIRRNYGGQWVKLDNDQWMIVFDEELHAHPFDMVGEQLENHKSLTQLFQRIPELFDHNASQN